MQKFTSLGDCIALAEFAHRNQTDKAGMPYIEHPRRVLANVQAQGAPAYVQMAAILHDVTEDTAFTCDILLTLGVPEAAVNIVRLVDREASARKLADLKFPGISYVEARLALSKNGIDDFYYSEIKKNHGAKMLKFADIGDNLQPWRLDYLPEEKQEYLQDKYRKALDILNG